MTVRGQASGASFSSTMRPSRMEIRFGSMPLLSELSCQLPLSIKQLAETSASYYTTPPNPYSCLCLPTSGLTDIDKHTRLR